ncbi:MAG: family 2 glycosyl transferase, partial [Pseudomonadota bacterium]
YWQDLNPDHFLIQTLEDFFPHQPGMVVRKSLYESVGPFDVSLKRSQDYEMLIRLARAAPCAGTDDIVFLQRQHDGARGVSGDRFAAHERDAKWMAHDQKIFTALRDELALSDYLPRGDDIKGDADRRKALLQRGVIFARKKLWDLATEDFETAAQLGSDTLSDEEQAILRRTLSSKYGCDEITDDPDIFASLRKLKTIEPVGSAILDGVLRGLRWRIREALQTGKPGHALHLVQRSLSAKLAR